MLKTLLAGSNGFYWKQSSTQLQLLWFQSFSVSISTNTAINNSLRRSRYEVTRSERRPSSRANPLERTRGRLERPRTTRLPDGAGAYERTSGRAENPRPSSTRRPPGRVGTYEKASNRGGSLRASRASSRVGIYEEASDRPEFTRARIRRPDHQQGQDGDDLTEAQRIHERYQELKQDRRIPRSITRRTKRVDKRGVVDELSQKSQYDYTSKPGGNRALRRAAQFGRKFETPEVESSASRLQEVHRRNQDRERRPSSGQDFFSRAPHRNNLNSTEEDQLNRRPRRTSELEKDTEEIDGLTIPEELRDNQRSYPEPRRRSFTMGRQDTRPDNPPFASRERDSGYERSAPSDTRDFGRYGRNVDHERAKNMSNVPLSIPYTTPASEFLYGTSVVTAALLSSRRKLYKLYIYGGENREAHEQDNRIRHLALDRSVVVERVKGDWLRLMDKMSLGRPHNGYILEASPLPKLPITGLQRVSKPQGPLHVVIDHQSREDEEINGRDTNVNYDVEFPRYPLVLLLDGILDPGNLGAILRTAFFLGVDAVAIANRSSAPLSSVALKASAGATESLPLMSVSQPGSFIDSCQNHGWKVFAAAAPNPRQRSGIGKYFSTSRLGHPVRDHPCLLILGGEGEGLRWNIQQKADFEVGIDGQRIRKGGVDSLNVSVAAGILCEAFLRKPTRLINFQADDTLKDTTSNDEVSDDGDIKTEDRLF